MASVFGMLLEACCWRMGSPRYMRAAKMGRVVWSVQVVYSGPREKIERTLGGPQVIFHYWLRWLSFRQAALSRQALLSYSHASGAALLLSCVRRRSLTLMRQAPLSYSHASGAALLLSCVRALLSYSHSSGATHSLSFRRGHSLVLKPIDRSVSVARGVRSLVSRFVINKMPPTSAREHLVHN
jgi:hypothetical protein